MTAATGTTTDPPAVERARGADATVEPGTPAMGTVGGSAVVVVSGLCKRFGHSTALDDVSLSVPPGVVFGLVGPNGGGKSTILRILATLLRADAGHAEIAGTPLDKDPAAVRAVIGYLPPFFGVYARLTVEEHLEFYAGIHEIPRSRRRLLVGEMLELVGLTGCRSREGAILSRGQRQRLGLARALVADPAVLLLDEPLSGLDFEAQLEIRDLIRELGQAGTTIVLATHDLRAVEQMCTWIGLLNAGRMAAVGPVAQLWADSGTTHRIELEVAVTESVLSDIVAAVAVAEAYPAIASVEVVGDALELALLDGLGVDDLVAHMLAQGIRVRSIGPAEPDLARLLARLLDTTAP